MMTKCHISVKDTSQTVEEAGKTHWVCSSPPPSLVTTSSKAPGPGWGAVVKLLLANQVSVFFVQQNQRLKFDIHLLMASTFNPNGPLSSTDDDRCNMDHINHLSQCLKAHKRIQISFPLEPIPEIAILEKVNLIP